VGIGACVPEQDDDDEDDTVHSAGCGCRIAESPSREPWGILALAAFGAGILRRRRR
jgi:MYXO-CTERM domain-containing protein